MKKEYTLTMTINVHFTAESEDHAQKIIESMNVAFEHPETLEEMDNDIIDWELKEQN